MSIPFTQFLRPDGKQRAITVDRSADIETKARALMAVGFRFEIEELTTLDIYMDCSRPQDDEPIANEISYNGRPVLDAVDRLVSTAYERWTSGKWPLQEDGLQND